MTFHSLAFAGFCGLAVLVLNLVRAGAGRRWLTLGLSMIFVSSFMPDTSQALPLFAFLLAGYGAILAAGRVGNRGLLILLTMIVCLFIWVKKYSIVSFLPMLDFPYIMVGLSYILFRILQIMIDVNQGALARPGFLSYAGYLLFFPTFVSGPIQRFQDHAAQMAEPALPIGLDELHWAFSRIVRGLFLITVVTVGTLFGFEYIQPQLAGALKISLAGIRVVLLFAAEAAIYVIHLYLNFVGYMDIVIGVGRLCGFRLPENFNRPYAAANLLDFWSRWHITLSEWFKTYLFNPVLKALAVRWGQRALAPYLGAAAFFVTFVVMGIWHGSTGIFLAYGLLLGSGMAINKLYQVEASRRLGKKEYKALCAAGWYRHLARAFGLAFFSIAVTCLWLSPNQAMALASPTGLKIGTLAFAFLAMAIALASAAAESILRFLPASWPRWHRAPAWTAPAWTAAKLLAVMTLAQLFERGPPEFVYKMF